jgi:hypothetical protein
MVSERLLGKRMRLERNTDEQNIVSLPYRPLAVLHHGKVPFGIFCVVCFLDPSKEGLTRRLLLAQTNCSFIRVRFRD